MGAMSDQTRHSPTSVVESACPLDCPDACSLSVSVREGKIVEIDGSRANPATGGYICAKVRRFDQLIRSGYTCEINDLGGGGRNTGNQRAGHRQQGRKRRPAGVGVDVEPVVLDMMFRDIAAEHGEI